MTLNEVLDMWDVDCAIDMRDLGASSIDTAKLHSKYLRIAVNARMKKASLDTQYDDLRQKKFRYYRGEMSRAELTELGWEQWQYNKPLKSEMDEFLKGDADLTKLTQRIAIAAEYVKAMELIMSEIKQRDFQISNAIKWKVFQSGS